MHSASTSKDIADCYRVLGVVHTTWRAVPGRFKDYISTPKQNNYQSIHTTVVGPRHQRVELQIRTQLMHQVAEYGVAAHALYKDMAEEAPIAAGSMTSLDDKEHGPYVWLRRMVETLLEGANPEEFLEHTKLELFQDQVFCFTPKGRLIALPRGATPLDFAYAVHTDVGNAAVGAYVNGRHVPIDTRAAKRRRGRDPDIQGACAAGGVGEPVRHGPGAERHPARRARGGATAVRGVGTAACDGGVRGGARDLHGRRGEARSVEVHAQVSRRIARGGRARGVACG